MIAREKLLVYPFDLEFMPILRHKEMLPQYDIIGLSSLTGWGFNGKDASCTDEGEFTGITVNCDYYGMLNECDTVLVSEPGTSINKDSAIYPHILEAISLEKNIACLMTLNEEKLQELIAEARKMGVYFKYFGRPTHNTNNYDHIGMEIINEVNTPIIAVAGLFERTQKFEIQLALRETLMHQGYKVSHIGTRHYCELFGFHSFPEFMYNNCISESNKVVMLNRFIKEIESSEKPDVIILGVPGAIMPYNNGITSKFGILAFEIFQSVTPDAAVLSVLFENYSPEYFRMLHNSIRYKLGFEIDCFNFSNTQIEYNSGGKFGNYLYLSAESKMVDDTIKKIHGLDIPVFNILNPTDSERISRYLIDKLTSYSSIVSF